MTSNDATTPVRKSICQVGPDSWLIGGKILLSRTDAQSKTGFCATWSDGAGAYFAITEVPPDRYSSTEELPPNSPIQLVHDAGDTNAAWRIGKAFCKVQKSQWFERTREHTTLEHIHSLDKPALSFQAPHALYHAEFGGCYYLITSEVPGVVLEEAWPTMEEPQKRFCVDRLVDICNELIDREGRGDAICGFEGKYLCDTWMAVPGCNEEDLSPQAQLAHCSELGMDCSNLVFYHCDMGPRNVIVDLTTEKPSLGIIDWEMAGFVPKDWIRTKFRVCWAMDFDFPGNDKHLSRDWRERVQERLGQDGFGDARGKWVARWDAYLAAHIKD